MNFRLTSLLALRRRTEEEAEVELGRAMAARVRREEDQRLLEEIVLEARARVDSSRHPAASEDGAQAGVAERWRARLRQALAAAETRARDHREGLLRQAVETEAAARAHHQHARRDREAIEKLRARGEADARVAAGRRAEDAAGDQALFAWSRGRPAEDPGSE